MQLLMIGLLSLFAVQPASAQKIKPSDVECTAWTHDQSERGKIERAVLKQTSFDADYYAAELGVYSFGADYTYLAKSGIGLIVFDNKSKRFADNTSGFRQIGDTNVRETDLKFYDRLPDGRTVVAGIQCSYLSK